MKLRTFAKDVAACAQSPWLGSPKHRLKAAAALFIDRWNEYSPLKLAPVSRLAITCNGREWSLPLRTGSEDFAAFREIFLYGYYDRDLGRPRTILDLGAYCGYTAIAFSARFSDATVAAVEPHPGNCAALRRNLDLNRLPLTVFQAAATVADGPVSLFLGGDMSHGLSPNRFSTGASIPVDGLSIETILDRLGWAEIDLLKIDIEGGEELLFGAKQPWLKRVKTIIGEYHGAYEISRLSSDLQPFGFEVTALDHRNLFLAIRILGPDGSSC